MGADGVKLYTSTGTMVERIQSGEHILGYDIIGSYVLPRSKQDPNLGMVLPRDFTLAFSRVAFISKDAPHPNAAKLFLDYLISRKGQETMAQQSLLYAIRPDAQGEATASALRQELGSTLKPIAVNKQLLDGLEPSKRTDWFRRWQDSMKG
jgi:iron(III) transport system substrate-binding protein